MARKAKRAAQAKGRPALVVDVQQDSERSEYRPSPPVGATLILRSIVNDDGHFLGLDVAHG